MNTPLNQLNHFEATQRLTQIVQEAYHRRSRQLPANLTEIVATLKADLLKYMPTVPIETIDEAVTFEVLHDDKTPLSPTFIFAAIRKHFEPPFKPRSWDVAQPTRPDTEQDTINLLDCCAKFLAAGKKAQFQPIRMNSYLVLRGQLNDDAYLRNIERAKIQINTARVRDFMRPISEWTPDIMDEVETVAKYLTCVDWINSCNIRGVMPSNILTPLKDEASFIVMRKKNP